MGTNYKYLSCQERALIQLSLEQGCTLRVIARSLQRAPSSISRELKRNGLTIPPTGFRKRSRPPLAAGYRQRLRNSATICAGRSHGRPANLPPSEARSKFAFSRTGVCSIILLSVNSEFQERPEMVGFRPYRTSSLARVW